MRSRGCRVGALEKRMNYKARFSRSKLALSTRGYDLLLQY